MGKFWSVTSLLGNSTDVEFVYMCVLQVLSIFAFATTTSFISSSSFQVNCNSTAKAISFAYGYPFE